MAAPFFVTVTPPLGDALLGVCIVVIAVGAGWDVIVIVGLAIDALRRRMGLRPLRVGVDYGAGEDAWFETTSGTQPYRTCDTRRLLARGDPVVAARQVGGALATRLGVVLFASAVTAAVDVPSPLPCSARSAAKIACSTIRQATMQRMAVHPGSGCPTVNELKAERELYSGFSGRDPWGSPYELRCFDEEIICTSAGPDRRRGTEDDIVVPTGEISR
jgi:general secretion pathway protein G